MNQKLFISSKKQEEARNYWLNHLDGISESSYFCKNYHNKTYHRCSDISTDVDESIVLSLEKFAGGKDPVIYVFLMSALYLSLYRFLGQSDIIISSPVYNYPKDIIMYNNSIPMRCLLDDNMTVKNLVDIIKNTVTKNYSYQYFPIESIWKSQLTLKESIEIDMSEATYEKIFLSYHNIHNDLPEKASNNPSEFSLSLCRNDGHMRCKVTFDEKYLKPEEAQKFLDIYFSVLHQMLNEPNKNIGQINIFTDGEDAYFIDLVNKTKFNYSKCCIHELIQMQSYKTPESIAVSENGRTLTYRQLNEKSNQLARILIKKDVHPDTIVGILAERTIDTIIGIIGILKAGGAFLPLHPTYPKERIKYILQDSSADILLVNGVTGISLPMDIEVISLEDECICNERSTHLEVMCTPSNLAYVIYTSGSTGNPKGALIEHKGLTNYVLWAQKVYVKEKEVFPLFTSLAFDLTMTSIFTPLVSGNEIAIYQDVKEGHVLDKILDEKKATIIKLTPSHLALIRDRDNSNSSVRQLILGGEDLKLKICNEVWESFGGQVEIYNEYGPTETVVGCMIHKYDPQTDAQYGSSVSIGTPADNVQIYVFNERREQVPLYGVGEIYISGHGVARGYLNRTELTDEKFIKYQYGQVLYKTGDLAKLHPGFRLQYLGRMDDQVKIRGFRIELSEIENVILSCNYVRQAIVTTDLKNDEQVNLCAFIVAGIDFQLGKLKEYLCDRLPRYMIPDFFHLVDAIPFTSNGKVDVKALRRVNINTQHDDAVPENAIEEMLLHICREVLGTQAVSVSSNFFHVGGDSIKAMLVSVNLKKKKLSLEVDDIFRYPIIRDMSRCIQKNIMSACEQEKIIVGQAELTPIQKTFFNQRFSNCNLYNQDIKLFSEIGFNEKATIKVLKFLLGYHDALRTKFQQKQGRKVQVVPDMEESILQFYIYDISKFIDYDEMLKNKVEDMHARVDIEKGLLMNASLFQTPHGDYLTIVIHHLVVDAVSLKILYEDFLSLYKQELSGEELSLPSKTSSYIKWSEKVFDYAKGHNMEKEEIYWKDIEAHVINELPKNNIISIRKKGNSQICVDCLSESETDMLLKNVNRAFNTEIKDILLTALGLAIKEWTGSNTIAVNLEGHGREERVIGLEVGRTVGWFTTVFPVILEMSDSNDMAVQIKKIKEMLRNVPNKGIGYGIHKYIDNTTTQVESKGIGNSSKSLRKDSMTFSPSVIFNYLGHTHENFDQNTMGISFGNAELYADPSYEREYELEINASIENKKFSISIIYDKYEFYNDNIKAFMNLYFVFLRDIITYCVQKEETEITPHDVSDEDIDMQTFEQIMDMLQDVEL